MNRYYHVKAFYGIGWALLLCLLTISSGSPAQTIVCPPNLDFELGNYSNWHYYKGTPSAAYGDVPDGGGCCPINTPTYCGYGTPCGSPNVRHQIVSGSGNDLCCSFPLVPPGAGAYTLKLGNTSVLAQAEKLRYYVHVPSGTTSYALFYRYAIVLQDPGHPAASQPRFEVRASDSATGVALPCAQYSYVSASSLPGFYSNTVFPCGSSTTPIRCKGWTTQSVILANYPGSTIAVDFATGDCGAGGHYAYAYVDVSCGLFAINTVSCGASTVSLAAPSGFAFYSWYDSSTFSPLLSTLQNPVLPAPSVPTTYACIIDPYPGFGCSDTIYTRITPSNLQLHCSNDTTICAGDNALLTDGATDIIAPITHSWSPATGLSCTTCGTVTATPPVTTTYTVTATNPVGCTKTDTIRVTVTPAPSAGAISGPTTVCAGATITLTSTVSGGTWSCSPGATISSTGVLTGVSAGTVTVTYRVFSAIGCSGISTRTITVNTVPAVNPIVGPGSVCAGSSISLTATPAGGTWSAVGTATISPTGVVTGISPGTATISYTLSNICGPAAATTVVTVNSLPLAGSISGPPVVCVGSTITLTSTVSGGVWSVSGGATISSTGVVTGVTAGPATVTYIFTNACGSDTATRPLTINPLPDPGTINPTSFCVGTTVAMTATVPGGIWSSVMPGVGSISSTGAVTGVSGGTTTISYTVSNSCGTAAATAIVTVHPPPSPAMILGPSQVCLGSTMTLYASVAGGIWTSSGTATVSPSGAVAGVSLGTSIISYTLTDSCGSSLATKIVTVNLLPDAGTISGGPTVCAGQTITMTAAVSGGTWSCSVNASISSAGVLTGISAGTATVSYTVTNMCGTATATAVVTVQPTPSPGVISSILRVCVGATTSIVSTVSGGTWTCASAGIASVTPTGVVTGITSGTVNVTYTVISGVCSNSVIGIVTVDPLPVLGTVTGGPSVCEGASISLSGTPAGGYWSTVGPEGSVSTTGVVSGLSSGTLTVIYTIVNLCGQTEAMYTVSVNPIPNPGTVAGPHTLCVGGTVTLSNTTTGGVWTSGTTSVAVVSSGGVVSGLTTGTSLISYAITSPLGCTGYANYIVTVTPLPPAGIISGPPQTCLNGDIQLTTTGSGGTWTSGNPAVVSVNSTTGAVHGVGEGTALITYTSGTIGCLTKAVFPLTILSVPNFVINETLNNIRCKGNADGSIAVFPAGGTGPWSMAWGNGSTSYMIKNLSPGQYEVEVTDSTTTCKAKKSFVISEPDSLEARTVVSNELCGLSNGAITVTVKGGIAPYKYMWSDNSANDHISDKPAGVYTVAVTDDHQCRKEITTAIAAGDCNDVVVHDGVSPNGDGVNDLWVIDGIGLYKNNLVQLFDKWGDKVFEQYGYDNKWDGKGMNGSVIPDGTYFYIVKLNWETSHTEGKDLWTGSLLIKR